MNTDETELKAVQNTFRKRLENDFLTCAICKEEFVSPKVLGCNHTFCRKCLASHIPKKLKTDGKRQGFACPVCHCFIPSPDPRAPTDQWVDVLQSNFVILSMQDMITTFPANAQWPKEESVPKPPARRTVNLICTDHDKLLDFYCDSHDAILCSDCVLIGHRFCSTITKCKEASNELLPRVPELKKYAQKHSEIVGGIKGEVHIQLSRLSEERLAIQQEIKATKEELVRKLEDLEKELLDDLDAVYRERKQMFDERLFQCNIIHCASKEATDVLTDIGKCTPNEIVKQILDRKSETQAEELLLKEVCAKTQECYLRMDINKSLRNVLMATAKLGDLNIVTSPLNLPAEATVYAPHRVEVNLNDAAPASLSLDDTLNVQTPNDKNYCWITGVTYTEDGRIAVVDCNNKKLKLFSTKLELLSEAELHSTSFDVTSVSESELAVSLPIKQRVKFIAINDNNARLLDREVHLQQLCYGVVHGLGKLFVNCMKHKSLPDCVKVFNGDDVLLSMICADSTGTPLFSSLNSSYISLCPKESMLSLVDKRSDRHEIVSFLFNGETLSRVRLSAWSDKVHGVAFYGKSLLVALDSGVLCNISSPQLQEACLTELSSDKSIIYPNATAVSPKMNRIVVSQVYPYYNCHDNNILKIFKPKF